MKKIKIGCLGIIIIFILLVIIGIFSGGGSSNAPSSTNATTTAPTNTNTDTDNNASTSSQQKSNTTNTPSADTQSQEPTKNNSTAKLTTLSAGNYIVGQNIPAGRYVIKSDGGSGNFVVLDKQDPVVNEILDSTGQNGVTSITTTLSNDEEIQISDINKTTFTPATTKLSDTLSCGNWVVGSDIAPGRYVVTPTKNSGNFVVEEDGYPTINEILDPTGQNGVKSYTCDLINGETIMISNMNKVNFTKQN